MSELDEVYEGVVTATKCRNGDARQIYPLELTGRDVYKLQRLLEARAVQEECYLDVEEAVLLSRSLREAVKQARRRGLPQGGGDGR